MKYIHTLILIASLLVLGGCSASRKAEVGMQIKQVMIFVADIAKAREFYCETLGLPIAQDLADEMGMLIINHEGCILTIHGQHDAHPYREGRKIVIAFGVDDIEHEVERLKGAGVEMIGAIQETPIHRYQALLDPSGNLVEIGEYK